MGCTGGAKTKFPKFVGRYNLYDHKSNRDIRQKLQIFNLNWDIRNDSIRATIRTLTAYMVRCTNQKGN